MPAHTFLWVHLVFTTKYRRGTLADPMTRARVLTGPDAAAHNTPQAPDTVRPVPLEATVEAGVLRVDLPPHAFATVELALD